MIRNNFITIHKDEPEEQEDIFSVPVMFIQAENFARDMANTNMEQRFSTYPTVSVSEIYDLNRPVNWRNASCEIKGYVVNDSGIERVDKKYNACMMPFASGSQILSKMKAESNGEKESTRICTVTDKNDIGLFTLIVKNGKGTVIEAVNLNVIHYDCLDSDWVQAIDSLVKTEMFRRQFIEPVTPKQINYEKNGNVKEMNLLASATYIKDRKIIFKNKTIYTAVYDNMAEQYYIMDSQNKRFYLGPASKNIGTWFFKI